MVNKLREYETIMLKKLKLQKRSSLGICLMIGTIVGVVTDNLGIWISLSICFGVVIDTFIKKITSNFLSKK